MNNTLNGIVLKSKNVYQMEYNILVPVSSGLKQLFMLVEELRSEFGVEPGFDHFLVNSPCADNKYEDRFDMKALVNYSRPDALRVLNDNMSEEEYIKRHIRSLQNKDGKTFTDGNDRLTNVSIADIL